MTRLNRLCHFKIYILSSTSFTWSILEYFVSNISFLYEKPQCYLLENSCRHLSVFHIMTTWLRYLFECLSSNVPRFSVNELVVSLQINCFIHLIVISLLPFGVFCNQNKVGRGGLKGKEVQVSKSSSFFATNTKIFNNKPLLLFCICLWLVFMLKGEFRVISKCIIKSKCAGEI